MPRQDDPVYDALLVPKALIDRISPSPSNYDRLKACVARWGHLIGVTVGSGEPVTAARVDLGPMAGHTLIVRGPRAGTINFPIGHPLGQQPRYDWTDLQDGAKVGRLRPDPLDRDPTADWPPPVPVSEPAAAPSARAAKTGDGGAGEPKTTEEAKTG